MGKQGRIFGYARVSSTEQNLHCKETWYVESVTAKILGESIGKVILEKKEVKKLKTKSKAKGKEPK